jgi:hypothetical protein
LLWVAALLHGGALIGQRLGWRRARLATAALAQLVLVAVLGGLTLRLLPNSDPSSWWPSRAGDVILASAWLTVLLFLIGGFWWRSPGLGLMVPLLTLGLMTLADLIAPAATVTRGLALELAWRPAFRVMMAGVVACTGLASAGLAARWLEHRALGQRWLGLPIIRGLITSAALLTTLLVATAGYAWFTRGQGAPLWTLQQTWLVASWLLLLIAAEAGWRQRPLLPALTTLAASLVIVSVALVAAVA